MDRQKESERERQRQREKANEDEGRKDAAMSSGTDVKRAGPSRVLPRGTALVVTTRDTAIRKTRNCTDCGRSGRTGPRDFDFLRLARESRDGSIYQLERRATPSTLPIEARRSVFYCYMCVCVCVCISIGKCNGIFSRLLGVASEDREGLADNLPDATNSSSTVDTSRTRRLHAKWFVKVRGSRSSGWGK